MLPDYYSILGIAPSADQPTVKAAYRRRAIECHPDRGGRHEEMVLVNEAWEILGLPERRQRYDAARQGKTPQPDAPINWDVVSARARAAVYPVRWADFERWLDKVAQDFQAVEWTKTKIMGWEVPESRRSASAKLFVFTGAAAGGIGTLVLLIRQSSERKTDVAPAAGFSGLRSQFGGSQPQRQPSSPSVSILPQTSTHRSTPSQAPTIMPHVGLTYLSAFGGAWLGKWLHNVCSRLLSLQKK